MSETKCLYSCCRYESIANVRHWKSNLNSAVLPHRPASHRRARRDPTSRQLWCMKCLSVPLEPETQESHRMYWSCPHNPCLGDRKGRTEIGFEGKSENCWQRKWWITSTLKLTKLSTPRNPMSINVRKLTFFTESKVCYLHKTLCIKQQVV